MPNSEFEKQVQQKMEDLKLAPNEAVWAKVEAGLPEKSKKRRWLIFILFFAVLMTASLSVWNILKKNKSNGQEDTIINKRTDRPDNENNVPEKNNAVANLAIQKNDSLNIIAPTNTKIKTSANLKIKISSAIAGDDNIADVKKIKGRSNGKTRIKVQQPEFIDKQEDLAIKTENSIAGTAVQDQVEILDPVTKNTESVSIGDKAKNTDTLIKRSIDSITTIVKIPGKKERSQKWIIGLNAAAGTSKVTSGLFSKASIFESVLTPVPNTSGAPVPVFITPNEPKGSAAFNVGIYLQKEINDKWKFNTGSNYTYQSNNIEVGRKVDSAASYSANFYYRPGNSSRYKNKFHLLEIPFSFEYKLSKKLPVYVEAGSSVALLLHSNALVFDSSRATYFTSPKIFNKLNVFFIAGIGVDLAQKTKFPFSISYQFKYGMASVTKTVFAKEHFINSMLSIRVPLKK